MFLLLGRWEITAQEIMTLVNRRENFCRILNSASLGVGFVMTAIYLDPGINVVVRVLCRLLVRCLR